MFCAANWEPTPTTADGSWAEGTPNFLPCSFKPTAVGVGSNVESREGDRSYFNETHKPTDAPSAAAPHVNGRTRRCLLPGHPDVVAVHATRAADNVPFLPEIVEHATRATTSGAPAGDAVASDGNAGPAKVRFVLAVTGGVGAMDGNGVGGGAISAGKEDSTKSSDGKPVPSTAAGGRNVTMCEDREGSGAAENPPFYAVEGRPDAAMLRKEVPDIADRHVLLCGPGVFMTAMEEAMKELGVPSSRIHSEEFYF